MLKGLAAFAMRGRMPALLLTVAGAGSLLFCWISAAVVALVTLRKGAGEGAWLLLWALLPAGALLYVLGDSGPLTLLLGEGCKLVVPERPFHPLDDTLPDFPPAEIAQPEPIETLRHEVRRQTVTREATTGTTTYTLHQDSGRIRYQNHGLELDDISTHTLTIRDDDPLSLTQEVRFRLEYQRGDWQVRMETVSKLTADATHFYLSNSLDAYEGSVRVFSKTWTKKIARNGL